MQANNFQPWAVSLARATKRWNEIVWLATEYVIPFVPNAATSLNEVLAASYVGSASLAQLAFAVLSTTSFLKLISISVLPQAKEEHSCFIVHVIVVIL